MNAWWAVLLAGCTSGARADAERALGGGEHVRLLTVPDQRAALAAFEALSCADRDVCQVKEACSKVAKPTLDALLHRDTAMSDVALSRDEDAAADLSDAARARADELLARAHAELEAGKSAVPDCEAALAVLARSAKGK